MKSNKSFYFLELNEDRMNETKVNETEIVYSSDPEQGINYGLTIFVTGMIILIVGILTLIVISWIFWFEWMYESDVYLFENDKLPNGYNKSRKFDA